MATYSDYYEGYPQKTVFEALEEAGKTWKSYYPQTTTLYYFSRLRASKYANNFAGWSQFKVDCESGNLPTYSFIEPRWYNIPAYPAQDQHPTHPVSEGEKLVKEIYEIMRASPLWEKSALLITYDEHGGFFDHVPLTKNIPNPDGINAKFPSPPCNFTYSGVRVPAIVVSAFIPKGTVEHTPLNNTKFAPNSQYEHSSLSKTFHTMYGSPLLTKRDQWAGDFSHMFSLTNPRKDCPHTLPNPNPKIDKPYKFVHNNKVSKLQSGMAIMAAALNKVQVTHDYFKNQTEFEVALFVQQHMSQFAKRTYGKETLKNLPQNYLYL